MPDITMCANDECPLASQCYRHEAEPNEYKQSYAVFEPITICFTVYCHHFWRMEDDY